MPLATSWWRRVDSNHRSETQQIYSLPPLATRELLQVLGCWSWWTDSNPRPADYKSAALPAELHQHIKSAVQQQVLFYQKVYTLSTCFSKKLSPPFRCGIRRERQRDNWGFPACSRPCGTYSWRRPAPFVPYAGRSSIRGIGCCAGGAA